MSKKSIIYIDSIKNNKKINDAFIISFLGLLGLSIINTNNNLLTLKMKKYRMLLNQISNDSLDVYAIIQHLYNTKKMKMSFALDLIDILQKSRIPGFTFSLEEDNIRKTIEQIPSTIYRDMNGQVKLYFKAYIKNIDSWDITKLVRKFYTYSSKEKMTELDFFQLAKKMKQTEER
jgi:hypothetical protein